jgi:hypothetical protein
MSDLLGVPVNKFPLHPYPLKPLHPLSLKLFALMAVARHRTVKTR